MFYFFIDPVCHAKRALKNSELTDKDYRVTTMIRVNLLVEILSVFKSVFIKETNCCHQKGNPESFALFLFLCFLTTAYKLK